MEFKRGSFNNRGRGSFQSNRGGFSRGGFSRGGFNGGFQKNSNNVNQLQIKFNKLSKAREKKINLKEVIQKFIDEVNEEITDEFYTEAVSTRFKKNTRY
jgi:hypothetical protein